MKTLQGRARIKRTMWSRRAQEYEAKINSGDLVSIAEVVRDLHRASDQPEQSYSERQLYESALDRMARELAAVEKVSRDDAVAEADGFAGLEEADASRRLIGRMRTNGRGRAARPAFFCWRQTAAVTRS